MLPDSMDDVDFFAIETLLDEFTPCYVDPMLPPHIAAHLEDFAKNQTLSPPESIMRYTGVCPYRKTWELVRRLSSRSRNDLFRSAICKGDWDLFQTFPISQRYQFVTKQNNQGFRPVEYILQRTTADDLWSYIETKKSKNLFFLSCLHSESLPPTTGSGASSSSSISHRNKVPPTAHGLLKCLIGKYGLSIDAFWEFSRLHLRSPPKETKDWSRWFTSYHCSTWKEHMSAIQTKIVAAALSVRPISRSRITLYARFVHEMLDLTCSAIETISSRVFVVEESVTILTTLRTYYDVLYAHYHKFSNPPPVVADLLDRMDKILVEIIIPRLVALFCFDHSDKEKYSGITRHLGVFALWYNAVYEAKPDREILNACLDSLESVMKNAQAGGADKQLPNGRDRFCEITTEQGKLQFVLYDTSLHQSVVKQCLNCMEAMVKISNEICVQERVNSILKSHNYFHDNLQSYINYCKHLIPELVANERSDIIRLSRITSRWTPHRLWARAPWSARRDTG
jgi:hypothetical protein